LTGATAAFYGTSVGKGLAAGSSVLAATYGGEADSCEKMESIYKAYNYISEFERIAGENDDTGRLQRAIDSSISTGKTLILNEQVTIGNQVRITNQLTIDGISWRTGKIVLSSYDACLVIANNGVNSHVYEVELNNVEIKGGNAAKHCIVLQNSSQIKLFNVYADRAVSSNIQIINSSILYFEKVYSYYSPIAYHIEACNNINFFNVNVWDNNVVYNIKGNATDLVLTDSWYEQYGKLFAVDHSVFSNLQVFSKGCHFLSSNRTDCMFLQSNEIVNDKAISIVITSARINMPTAVSTCLFEVASKPNNPLIKIDVNNSYLFIPAAVTHFVKNNNINHREHCHVAYEKNRSADIEAVTDYAKAIILGSVVKYNGEQVFYNAFVLPQSTSTLNTKALKGTMYFDNTNDRIMVKDSTGNFRLIPFKASGYLPDSTAEDIPSLRSDLNALLTKLRQAKVID
jgi:hypothetical protein